VKVVRFAVPTLKAFEHVCEVKYKLFIHEKETDKFSEIDETHSVRFIFLKNSPISWRILVLKS
jgi:hypothetical protein